MAKRRCALCRRPWYYQRVNLILGALLLGLAGMLGLVSVTDDEEPQVVCASLSPKNEGCEEMATNPLRLCRNADVSLAVQKYYARLAEHADYVDSYDDLIIYSKNGMTKGTYVVFVTYHLHIKDTFTPVPGLGTLLARDTKDGVMLDAQTADVETQQYIARLTRHADTAALFHMVELSYARAVHSDALLAESLSDLQKEAAQGD